MKHILVTTLFAAPLIAFSPITAPVSASNESDPSINQGFRPKGWIAKSLPEIAEGLRAGKVTSEALVTAYLNRVSTIDKSGPTLQSILTLNPNALAEARALDAKLASGEIVGPLHGVPILLKDNIESRDDMPTTAGALALKDNITGRDSPLVAGLRSAGAIILGKTNLSQWANFRSTSSMSGWTALGGQVRNPHMLDRNPCGSSSGSGASTAASLAAGTVGTETNGSISCPSNSSGIVGFKPTVGLVSQQHIIPISSSQDTAGPMTKTVKGAAMMLDAMATDPAKTGYAAALDANSLDGKRVGVLRYSTGSNQYIIDLFNNAVEVLKSAGATIIEIEEDPVSETELGDQPFDLMVYEFKAGINEYLASTPSTVKTRNLEQLIAFNEKHADVELALFDQNIFEMSHAKGSLDQEDYIDARDTIQEATREDGIDALLDDHDLDFLVTPTGPVSPRVDPINGDVWPEFPGAGWVAALAGYPHLTVPMGTVRGIPVGFSFLGAKDQDAAILSYGYAYEQRTNLRAEPQYLTNAEDDKKIHKAMRGTLHK